MYSTMMAGVLLTLASVALLTVFLRNRLVAFCARDEPRCHADACSRRGERRAVDRARPERAVALQFAAPRGCPAFCPDRAGAHGQQFGRVAPDRLAHGIAHVVTRQADVDEQRHIQLRQYGNVPAVSDGAVDAPNRQQHAADGHIGGARERPDRLSWECDGS